MKKLSLFVCCSLVLVACSQVDSREGLDNQPSRQPPVSGSTNPKLQQQFTLGQLAAGNHHSLWLRDGKLYGLGENKWAQLGQGNSRETANRSVTITGLPSVVAVFTSSGGNHSFALDEAGHAYGWGWNNLGQVGTGTQGKEDIGTPVLLKLPPLKAAALGTGHTLALAQDGDLYGWGRNNLGQLAQNDRSTQLQPVLIMKGVKAVASGINHVAALNEAGEVYTWGSNSHGQIGNGTNKVGEEGAVVTPYKVPLPAAAVAIAAGNLNTFAILETGVVYAWGDNKSGVLGDGTEGKALLPKHLSISDVVSIQSGARHTLALLKDGRVMAWGDNKLGQLGSKGDATLTPREVHLPEKATEISTGTNHNLVRLASGKVMGFGGSEHGRLGEQSEKAVMIPVPLIP